MSRDTQLTNVAVYLMFVSACKRSLLSFDVAKVRRCFQPNMMFFRMFRILFSPLRLLFSFPFSSACFPPY